MKVTFFLPPRTANLHIYIFKTKFDVCPFEKLKDGYRFFKEQPDFEAALIRRSEEEIIPAVEKGLCGAVYTQVSDVEDETNGLLSYDRKVCKVAIAPMKRIAEALYAAVKAKRATEE